MADSFSSPSAFSNAMGALQFRLTELHGHAPRTQATLAPRVTLASAIVPASGRIAGFRMQCVDTGTTSSSTYNTVALYKATPGSITYTAIGTLRCNRGSNGASKAMGFSGATALCDPGTVLVIRRLTKLNTASQIFVSAEVNKEVS